ncbi:MAG: hypothetical protein A2Z25_06115 [Planctomycetes bacterium RBG_16_55_9]|nr:MAG: hypothetical protein A2Z25_06115 [Planctomycetes bacterium RBG_16_55_9]
MTKRQLARAGSAKYAIHGPNEILRPAVLRDGRAVYEFIRCNPHWGGVSSCDQGRHIGEVLTDEFLTRLVEREGTCILYTHLGKIDDPEVPFNKRAVTAFRRLAEEFCTGRILGTTTQRLLEYRRAVRETGWTITQDANHDHIAVQTQSDDNISRRLCEADLAGLTFYVSDPSIISMSIDGRAVVHLGSNGPDHTGRRSVSLPWLTLEFPSI